ncbi:hypothetical protein ACFOMD_15460 [Sphingoaurantiacus capsulatus]|uniref:Uncharacterized protein n=1 Tax=Sphingoaurantiacus capsulatus TaxID=1771310 RepID=A0ABV7XCS3_9SPHN
MAIGFGDCCLPGLAERFSLIIAHYRPAESLGAIGSTKEFLIGLRKFAGIDPSRLARRTFERWRNSDKLPLPVAEAICRMYPALQREVLFSPTIEAFRKGVGEYIQAQARWAFARAHVSTARHRLAQLARQHYVDRGVTDGKHPLLCEHGWLLSKFVELREFDDFVSAHDASLPPPLVQRLPGGAGTFADTVAPRTVGSGAETRNNDEYRLTFARPTEHGLQLTFGPSKYLDYVNGLEVLAAEIADADLNGTLGHLPMRSALGDPFNLATRAAIAGVNVVLLTLNYRPPNTADVGDYFWIHVRATGAFEAQNVRHVVPAGSHGPSGVGFPDTVRDIPLWRTIMRELLQEVFGIEGAVIDTDDGSDPLDAPASRDLATALRNPQIARFYLTGLGLDPLTTKPEILAVGVLDMAALRRRTSARMVRGNFEGVMHPIKLTKDALREQALSEAIQPPMLPAGAAALLQAANLLDVILADFVTPPISHQVRRSR